MNSNQLRPRTVKIISQLLKPLVEEGVVYVAEEEIIHSSVPRKNHCTKFFHEISPVIAKSFHPKVFLFSKFVF